MCDARMKIGTLCRNRALLLVALFCLVCATSCSHKESEWYIGFSQCANDEWRVKMNRDMLREAMLYDNISLEILTANGDNAQQMDDIRYFIDRGVDLLVVSPNEAVAISPIVEEAYNKGIPVIVVDRNVQTDCYTAFVGANNYQIGEAVGGYVRSLLPRGGNVVEITGLMGSTPAIERHRGFIDGLEGAEHLELLCSEDAMWITDKAYSEMLSILSVHDDVDVVFAHNDIMAYGAYCAAKSVGREKNIKFVGIDALPGENNGVGLVSRGILDATFMYPSGVSLVLRTASDILEGREFQRETILSTAIIDKTNVKVMEMQGLFIAEQEMKIEQLNARVGAYLDSYSSQRTITYMSMIFIVLVIVMLVILASALKSKLRLNQKLLEQNQDILEQKSQLETQRDQLIELSEQLEKDTQQKLDFFTNISHDFRTPLTLIADPVRHLKESDNLSEEQRELLKLADKNIDILLKLVNQILDFRKFKNNALRLEPSAVNLMEYVLAWNNSFSMFFNEKAIKFQFSAEEGESYVTMLDIEKIERVYFNVLSNAVKFTPANGRVDVRLGVVNNDGKRFRLSIANTGSYIPQEQSDRIFTPFYQYEKNHEGYGLGLTISHAFVTLHKGTFTYESDKNEGTKFIIELPAVEVVKKEIIRVPGRYIPDDVWQHVVDSGDAVKKQDVTTAKPQLLIIDDNADLRRYVKMIMGGKYNVIEATDGLDGLRKAKRLLPDVIVSDVRMPIMDGIECCKRLKEEVLTCHIPVILLTTRSLEQQQEEGVKSGADAYISKPFNSSMLTTTIDSAIENRRKVQLHFAETTSLGDISIEDVSDKDRLFIEQLRALMEKNLDNPDVNMELLGNALGVSRVQLYRKTKTLTNFAPNDLLRTMRLKRAALLLEQSELTISEVSYNTGFNSPSYFTRCFKNYYNESPAEYRKRKKI